MITRRAIYDQRRQFLKKAACLGLLPFCPPVRADDGEMITAQSLVSGHCNYYEFSTSKTVIKHLAADLTLCPWDIKVKGLVERPLQIPVTALTSEYQQIQRTYPLRCVEGWVATIPWAGIQLAALLQQAKPLANARFVKFIGTYRPKEMVNQRSDAMAWPYTEGLRIDEAMHPLTMLATGMYDKTLTPENGAPCRLVVPWKYGYKSIKAIQSIELTAEQPVSTWMQKAPSEYGFYANVNPDVPHPRWSQRRELPLGHIKKRPTRYFNGFADEVSHLYSEKELTELV